ncbi:hypothetical protein CCH16_004517 [Salmonella enterica subsp. enterica serovar Orion]|nr:hypothetical protein [Salmonella enterica subsp. enterica serovar Schwarzengrund]EDQ9240694.1 hypothetical protein [Salmonella enterica subsp. enterica serovar Orion]EDR0541785.1 hypothetical protein [Salmonella enterica subsp. enterica serovar Orion]EDT8580947.1 hypothetical protein [Salmonella enterica subsp. enterica serovar Orion]
MEAPDEVTCVCGVKWRRKPGVAGYLAINSATLPPALISLNPLRGLRANGTKTYAKEITNCYN